MANDNTIPVACFAPPLTEETLAKYESMIAGIENAEIKDAMQSCFCCVQAWWQLPESKRKDGKKWTIKNRGRDTEYVETPLENEHVVSLWDVTPWDRECDSMAALFDTIPVVDPIRNAAYHLLWHCKEITRDREPLTADKL